MRASETWRDACEGSLKSGRLMEAGTRFESAVSGILGKIHFCCEASFHDAASGTVAK